MGFQIKRRLDQPLPHGAYDIDSKDYFNSPGISNSDLSLFAVSARHYEAIKLGQTEKKTSPQMSFGTKVHTAILEPWRYETDYIVPPKVNRRTKDGRASYEEFQNMFGDKTCLKEDEAHAIKLICENVKNYKDDQGRFYIQDHLLKLGHVELSMYAKHEATQRLLRGRIDYTKLDGHLVDVKTTRSARKSDFMKSVVQFRYYVQAAMYLDLATKVSGITYDKFTFVVIETQYPYEVAVYHAEIDMIKAGRKEYNKNLLDLESCLIKKNFPGYQTSPETIGLPAWFTKLNDEFEFTEDEVIL